MRKVIKKVPGTFLKTKRYLVPFFAFFVVLMVNTAFASEAGLRKEINELKARVAELERKLDACSVPSTTHAPCATSRPSLTEGLSIGAGATFIIQGTNDANATSKAGEDVTDASYSVDLEVEKQLGDFGTAFIHLETGDGAGVEDELTLFSNVNRDADDSDNALAITEAWYEHSSFDDQLTLTVGKIDASAYLDQNEIANDECGQFLGHIFRNASTIQFPDNNAGIRGFITPEGMPWLEVEAQALDGDDDWEDIADHLFISGQLNFKKSLIKDRDANYRIYYWNKDTNHITWNDTNQQWESNHGWGISADQELSDVISLFARYGYQDPDVYASGADFSLEHSLSGGCQVAGSAWGRDDDHLGLAVGVEMPSDDYKNSQNRNANDEGHFEAYYSYKLNDHLTLSPDFQMIWDAYGDDVANRDDTIYVLGTRAQVDF